MWKRVAVVAIVLTGASVAVSDTHFIVEFSWDNQFNYPPIGKVDNVPVSIRNVPVHHADPWGTPGPIRQDACSAPWLCEVRVLDVGLETELGNSVRWKNYVDASINWGYWAFWGSNLPERNYTNAVDTEQRGYGAALTFWSPDFGWFIPGFRSEFYFPRDNKE